MLIVFRDVFQFSRQSLASIVLCIQVVVLFVARVKFEKRGVLIGPVDPVPECKVLLRGDFRVPFDLRSVGAPSSTCLGFEFHISGLGFD